MPLNVLQLSKVKKRAMPWRIAECFMGGVIGAIGALVLLGWLL